jgi:ATP-binding cassette, subfamily C, bacterial CydCD
VKRFDRRLVASPEARRGVLIATVCGVAQSVCIVVGAVALATVVTGAFQRHQDAAALAPALSVFAAAVVVRAALIWLGEASGHTGAAAAIAGLRMRALTVLVARGPVALAGTRSGETSASLTSGLDALDHYFARFLPQVVGAVAVPVVAIGYVFSVDWVSALILLVTLPLIPLFAALIGRAAEESTRKRWQTFQLLGGHFLDVLQGLPTLRLFGRGRAQVARLRDISDRLRSTTMATLRIAFISSFALELLASLGVALLAVTIAVRLVNGTLDLRSGLTVLILAPEIYLPMRNLGATFHSSMEGVEAAGAVMDMIAGAADAVSVPALSVQSLSIALEHVGFAHAGRASGLSDINVVINAGQRVVLRGRTGAGKSTVLSLILGLVHAEHGTVHVAGIDVAGTQVLAWRDAIAWLPQHPHLFRGSIADNVRLGRPDATDADVREALTITGATFVDDLPDGLNTVIGERGLTLSGGQRQRIALARTLLRGSPIVLLDEPLAHLDTHSRASVAGAIERCTRGRTVVIAAHELDNFGWTDTSIDLEETASEPAAGVLEVAAP